MPKALHAELASRSDAEGVSLNQFIVTALGRAVSGDAVEGAPATGPARERSLRIALDRQRSRRRDRRSDRDRAADLRVSLDGRDRRGAEGVLAAEPAGQRLGQAGFELGSLGVAAGGPQEPGQCDAGRDLEQSVVRVREQCE